MKHSFLDPFTLASQVNFLQEALLAGMQQASQQGIVLPVSLEAEPNAVWGVGGRPEIPWASSGLRHIELTLSQLKAAIHKLLSSFDRVSQAIRCGERRQQRQMPDLHEEAREYHQAEFTCCTLACCYWALNWLFMESYWNPILRCLLCPCLTLMRCINCLCYSKQAREAERVQEREDEFQRRLEEERQAVVAALAEPAHVASPPAPPEKQAQ